MLTKTDYLVAQAMKSVIIAAQVANGQPVTRSWEEMSDEDRERSATRCKTWYQDKTTAEEAHDKWRAERESQGWTLSPDGEYHRELLQSPWLKPFNELPSSEKFKDIAYEILVPGFYAMFWEALDE